MATDHIAYRSDTGGKENVSVWNRSLSDYQLLIFGFVVGLILTASITLSSTFFVNLLFVFVSIGVLIGVLDFLRDRRSAWWRWREGGRPLGLGMVLGFEVTYALFYVFRALVG